MTRVELSNVAHDAAMQKTIIEIPDDQWARMTTFTDYAPANRTINRAVTTCHDGTHIVVDTHDGGSVIIWRELPD